MNKKLVALLLSSVMTAGLVGCGSSDGAQTAPSANKLHRLQEEKVDIPQTLSQ